MNWVTKEGKSIPYSDIEDQHLINVLRMLKKYATRKWEVAYCAIMDFPIPNEEWEIEAFENVLDNTSKITWRDYVHSNFKDLEIEASRRNLDWDLWYGGPAIDKDNESYIDLNNRGLLEKMITGAVRDAIRSHGPITIENAPSTAKRIIGAIKGFNKTRSI